MTMTKILAVLLLVPALAFGAEEGVALDRAPINAHDTASLQRGARVFVNYCLNCHSASYMRYNRLQDIGLSEKQILDNFVFSGGKVGDLMKTAIDPKDAKEFFGAAPPDLTVIARSRASGAGSGADWLYTYLRGFYRDSTRPTGWNNTVYHNVGMPHVLWELQGEQVMKEEKVRADGYMATVERPVMDKPGKLSALEYDQLVGDLVNYMVYMGEPAAETRKKAGMLVLLVLGLMIGLIYALKKEFWKDVH